jgi:hypothetical protein
MGLLTQMRRMAAGPRARLIEDLTTSYQGELKLAEQLRAHAGSVPYPTLAGSVHELADSREASATKLRGEIEQLGGSLRPAAPTSPRNGRNYWERLTFDLDDLRVMSRRYVELAQHWDIEYPDAAALFSQLARASGLSGQRVRDLIARSDSHAVD